MSEIHDEQGRSDPELNTLSAALQALTPRGGLDRDTLMFRAGQASVPRRRSWLWPCSTAALGLVSLTLGAILVLQPPPQAVQHSVYYRVEGPLPATDAIKNDNPPSATENTPTGNPLAALPRLGGNYLEMREQALAHGIDSMPRPQAWPATAPSVPSNGLLYLHPGLRGLENSPLKSLLPSGDS
jgi:hypothetical protein